MTTVSIEEPAEEVSRRGSVVESGRDGEGEPSVSGDRPSAGNVTDLPAGEVGVISSDACSADAPKRTMNMKDVIFTVSGAGLSRAMVALCYQRGRADNAGRIFELSFQYFHARSDGGKDSPFHGLFY